MRRAFRAIFAIFFATIGACANLAAPPVPVGAKESEVVAKLGQPSHRYQDADGHLLEYAHGPWGQTTYMARIDADGRLVSYEQVLKTEKFASIEVGHATKKDILHTIGAPSETTFLSLPQLEVWSYPYKENGVWDSMMHVHFDKDGIVRKMMNGPDPRFDPDSRWPFSSRHR